MLEERYSSCKISSFEVIAIFYLFWSIVFVLNRVGQITLLPVWVWMQ